MVTRNFFIILYLSFVALSSTVISAQENVSSISEPVEIELPELNVLLVNALRNSSVEYYEALIASEKNDLNIESRSWLKYFKLEGSYRYGINGVRGEGGDPLFRFSDRGSNWYNVGVNLSIPLDDVTNIGLRRKKHHLKLKEIEKEQIQIYDELKMRIVDVYTEALNKRILLKMKNELFLLANSEYEKAEANFLTGKINSKELYAEKSNKATALQEYEETKNSLHNSLLKLEILSQTQIISK